MSSKRQASDMAIDLFLNEMSKTINIVPALWKEPLRVVLTTLRPTPALKEFHGCVRAAVARSRYDEPFVDLLLIAVEVAERSVGLGESLAPISLALSTFAGSISRRPAALMTVVNKLLDATGVQAPLRFQFPTLTTYHHKWPIKPSDAIAAIDAYVNRAIRASLDEQGRAVGAFSSWTDRERLAGMEAIWMAYTYCEIGVARSGVLAPADLRRDLARDGVSLWNRLDASMDDPVTKYPLSTKSARDDALSKLRVIIYKPVSTPPAPPRAISELTSQATRLPAGELTLVVCRNVIPGSSERECKEEIERHRVLEEPLPVTEMPTAECLRAASGRLLSEFPWAESAIHTLFDDLIGRANLGVRRLTLPATLFVGRPGSGKSRLARRIAEELGLPRIDISLSGNSDTKQLGGTSRGWAGGRPSDMASLMALRRTASLLVTLNEIDKATERHHVHGVGVAAYLLPLLEPETASHHYDSFLKTECDFSHVSWIATGNTLSSISKALQSRLRILLVPQPRLEHLPAVCVATIKDLERRWQLPAGALPSAAELGIDERGLISARQARLATESALSAWAYGLTKQ